MAKDISQTWTLQFVDETSQTNDTISSVTPDALGSGANEQSKKSKSSSEKEKAGFNDEFGKKVGDDLFKMSVISPLNTMTGGLASPIYRGIKQVAKGNKGIGAIAGGVAGAVAMIGIQYAINSIEKRMSDISARVDKLNNNDNVLIRAGAVSKTTYYSGNFWGIKKRTNRS